MSRWARASARMARSILRNRPRPPSNFDTLTPDYMLTKEELRKRELYKKWMDEKGDKS